MNQEVLKRRDGTIYKTAIYLCLSRDDGDKNESDSITNQRKLIQDYIEDKSEFHLVDEYVDDGYSGSNFERPGWKQLYEDLERGAVNCIIVKDTVFTKMLMDQKNRYIVIISNDKKRGVCIFCINLLLYIHFLCKSFEEQSFHLV